MSKKNYSDYLFFPFNILIPNSLLQIPFFLLQLFNLVDFFGYELSLQSTTSNLKAEFGNTVLYLFHSWQPYPFYILIIIYLYCLFKYLSRSNNK